MHKYTDSIKVLFIIQRQEGILLFQVVSDSPRSGSHTAWSQLMVSTTVAHKYNTSLICTLPLCRAAVLLCWAPFASSKHFSAMPSVLSAMPSIFQLCWALFCSAKHFFSMLIAYFLCQAFYFCSELFCAISQLFRAFFGHAKHVSAFPIISLLCWEVFGSSNHFSAMLSIFSALRCIFQLCWALSALPNVFRLC